MKHLKRGLLLLALLAGLFCVYQLQPRSMGEAEALHAMLKVTGAEVVEGEVQFYAILDEQFRTMEELELTLLDVADRLGVEEGEVFSGEGETYRVLDVTGQTAFGPQVHIVVQSNPGSPEAGYDPQTYLLVVCRDKSVHRFETIVQRIDEVLLPLAPHGQISFFLTGELSGKKTSSEMDEMARLALRAVRGHVIEEMKDVDIISLSGYTPLVDRYVEADGERFNLNLAVRYDNYQDKTMLWAGFPLIHSSY